MSSIEIELNEDESRFQAEVEGHLCVLDFKRRDDVVSMDHVGVPDAVGGRGIAGQLTRHALDWADERSLKVRARCPYVAAWIERHPDYQRLLA